MLVLNLTIEAPARSAAGLRVKNITVNGNVPLQHTYPYYGDSWHVVTLAPTQEYGWVAVSLWQPTTIILDVHMTCGADDAATIHITVPAPGFPQSLAVQVKAAALSSQLIALVAGGGSSGAALGRLMATRSMVMCDADVAVGGGVLDFGLAPCSSEDNSNNAARSAVISNVVLVCIVTFIIFICGILLTLANPSPHAVLRSSAVIVLLPSSLLSVFVSILPSTAAGATLLAARIESSQCAGIDAVLILAAIGTVSLPIVALLWLHRYVRRWGWECVDELLLGPHHSLDVTKRGLLRGVRSIIQFATRRRYKWREALTAKDPLTLMFQHMWVVLLEYRTIWYAAVDGCGLVAVGAFSVVGGLSSSKCRPFTGLVIALLCLQLLLLNVVWPYTTLFEHVCSSATLALTVVSVVGQLVFTLETPGPEWLLMMSAVCNLAIVGVSLVKSVLDASALVMGLGRRIRIATDQRSSDHTRSRAAEGTPPALPIAPFNTASTPSPPPSATIFAENRLADDSFEPQEAEADDVDIATMMASVFSPLSADGAILTAEESAYQVQDLLHFYSRTD